MPFIGHRSRKLARVFSPDPQLSNQLLGLKGSHTMTSPLVSLVTIIKPVSYIPDFLTTCLGWEAIDSNVAIERGNPTGAHF